MLKISTLSLGFFASPEDKKASFKFIIFLILYLIIMGTLLPVDLKQSKDTQSFLCWILVIGLTVIINSACDSIQTKDDKDFLLGTFRVTGIIAGILFIYGFFVDYGKDLQMYGAIRCAVITFSLICISIIQFRRYYNKRIPTKKFNPFTQQ